MLHGGLACRGRILRQIVVATLAGLGTAPAGQAAVTSESTFGTGGGQVLAQTTSSDQVIHQPVYHVPETSGPTSVHLTTGQVTADQTSSSGQAHGQASSSEDETVAIDSQSTHVTWTSTGSVASSLHPAGTFAPGSLLRAFGSDGAVAGLRFTIDAPASFTLSGSESGRPGGCLGSTSSCGDPISLFSVAPNGLATPVAQIQVGAPETTLTGTINPGSYLVQGHTAAIAQLQAQSTDPDVSASTTMGGHFDFRLSAGLGGCPVAKPVSSVKAGQVLAEGCFVERKDSKGNGTGVFETDEQAWVGGFEVDPAFGGKFVVDTKTPALSEAGAGVDVKIDGTTTPIEVGDLPINTTDGTLDLNQAGTAAKALLDLPVKGKLKVSWSDGGRSSGLDGEVSLKAAFSNFIVATNSKGSEGEFKFKLKQTNKTGLVVNQASAKIDEVALIPKEFKVPKQFVLHNLTATYDRKNGKPLWSFGGLLGIPFKDGPLDIGGRFFWSEGPAGGGISVDGIDKEIGGTPFFLQKLDGDLVFKPDFGVNATVGVTFGPRVEGKQLAVLEGNLASGVLVSSSDCPNGLDPFKIEGKVKLAKLDFTDTLIKLEGTERTCTYAGPIKGADATIKLTAEFAGSTGLTDMGVEATTSGFIGQTGFNDEGSATLKLPIAPAITGSMIFSNQGIAACGKFNAAFQGGIGYRWGHPRRACSPDVISAHSGRRHCRPATVERARPLPAGR